MPSGPTLEIPTSIGHNLRNVKYSCTDPFIQLYNDVMSIERKTGKGVTELLIFMQVIYILHLPPFIIFLYCFLKPSNTKLFSSKNRLNTGDVKVHFNVHFDPAKGKF